MAHNFGKQFSTTFKLTSASETFRFDIPVELQINKSRFVVNNITGKMTTNPSAVMVHSPELSSSEKWSSINYGNDLIATTALTTTISNPISHTVSTDDVGYRTPHYLQHNPRVTINLRDDSGASLSDIDYILITITFYTTD